MKQSLTNMTESAREDQKLQMTFITAYAQFAPECRSWSGIRRSSSEIERKTEARWRIQLWIGGYLDAI